jgi:uncharacterized MAPEG superfamily protein
MTPPLWSLLGFVVWTMAIVGFGIGGRRLPPIFAGRAKPRDFPADQPHGNDAYRRTLRAHANCVENLPLFGSLVVVAALIGLKSELFDWLAVSFLVARILQSSVHMASGSNRAIMVRFAFFCVQFVCMLGMVLSIVVHST